ncbi:MAG: flagellar FlbD family protein [Phycisphaerales bacterium]
MIGVTRLNGTRFVINAELIRTVEANPDTIVTLITGERMVVREPPGDIVRKTIEYGRLLRRSVPIDLPDDLCGNPPSSGGAAGEPRERAG